MDSGKLRELLMMARRGMVWVFPYIQNQIRFIDDANTFNFQQFLFQKECIRFFIYFLTNVLNCVFIFTCRSNYNDRGIKIKIGFLYR